MNEIPIIRMELEHHRLTLLAAITDRLTLETDMVREALDKVITPGYLQATLERDVRQVLDKVIHEEVESYYRYGEGRRTLKAALNDRISRMFEES